MLSMSVALVKSELHVNVNYGFDCQQLNSSSIIYFAFVDQTLLEAVASNKKYTWKGKGKTESSS